MDLTGARKAMEAVLATWRAAGAETLPLETRRRTVNVLLDLERLEFDRVVTAEGPGPVKVPTIAALLPVVVELLDLHRVAPLRADIARVLRELGATLVFNGTPTDVAALDDATAERLNLAPAEGRFEAAWCAEVCAGIGDYPTRFLDDSDAPVIRVWLALYAIRHTAARGTWTVTL